MNTLTREDFPGETGAQRCHIPGESVADVMLVMDEHSRILSANHAGETIFGYDRQELIGKSFTRIMPEGLREQYRDKIEQWLSKGEKCVSYPAFEWLALAKDGREIPLNLSFGYLRREGRHFFIAMIHDVSKCKHLETDLARSNARLDGIINSAMDAIISIDAEQRIVVFNPAAEKMFGIPAHQAIGLPMDRFIPERFRAAHREHVINFGKTGETSRCAGALPTIFGLRANGEEFPIEASISQTEILRETGGKSWKEKSLTAILRDVTGRLQMEKQLRNTNEELLKRTRDLEETIAELKVFTYSLSHDMRAPLRSMKAFSDILLEECSNKLAKEEKDYLERINHSARRMDQLIQDVMVYKQVCDMPIAVETVGLEQLIHDIIPEHPRLMSAAAGIRMVTPLLPVMAHEGLLARCVANLLVNAVKFVAADVKPQVKIWTERRESNVRVWIKDNGIGIDPRFHGRIFNFFERLHGGGTDEGTGIGLSLVQKGIARMGGKVGVESEAGNGSRFWFELPTGRPEPKNESAAATSKNGTVFHTTAATPGTAITG